MTRPADSLAQRLRLARSQSGLTQAKLASVAGIKQADVSKIEGGRILQTTAIARLADALKVSARWLELGAGEMFDRSGAQVHISVSSPIGAASVMAVAKEPPGLDQALPVVLEALAGGLNEYRAGQIVQALQAATKPGAPLDQIERDLLGWLDTAQPESGKRAA